MRNYPTAFDYKTAILNPGRFIFHPILRHARPVMHNREPILYSGGFARVYAFVSGNRKYAFRCWISDAGNVEKAYHRLSGHLKSLNSPHFIPFEFLKEAILVNGNKYPAIVMDWIEDCSLTEFIEKNINNPTVLEIAAESFLQMTDYLHSVHIAHGDLQADNIRIRNSGRSVAMILIDYDTMFIPALRGTPSVNAGLPGYQHPKRHLSKEITEVDDYFAELVIYLTLLALAQSPTARTYFLQKVRDKDLLFSGSDFAEPFKSSVFRELVAGNNDKLSELASVLLRAARAPSIKNLDPLRLAISKSRGRNLAKQELDALRSVTPLTSSGIHGGIFATCSEPTLPDAFKVGRIKKGGSAATSKVPPRESIFGDSTAVTPAAPVLPSPPPATAVPPKPTPPHSQGFPVAAFLVAGIIVVVIIVQYCTRTQESEIRPTPAPRQTQTFTPFPTARTAEPEQPAAQESYLSNTTILPEPSNTPESYPAEITAAPTATASVTYLRVINISPNDPDGGLKMHQYARESSTWIATLPYGYQGMVQIGAPIRNGNDYWIPVRADEFYGYVNSKFVAQVTQ
jgi:serine/threonine protein kinase